MWLHRITLLLIDSNTRAHAHANMQLLAKFLKAAEIWRAEYE